MMAWRKANLLGLCAQFSANNVGGPDNPVNRTLQKTWFNTAPNLRAQFFDKEAAYVHYKLLELRFGRYAIEKAQQLDGNTLSLQEANMSVTPEASLRSPSDVVNLGNELIARAANAKEYSSVDTPERLLLLTETD
jgi:hypothetical protein